jgi:hypothetical protein
MNRLFGLAVVVAATVGVARAGIDKGSCSVAGSTLQFCDPAGVACTTSAGEAGTCTQRRQGCECLPKKTSICHRDNGPRPYVQIDVSNNAVAAHLRHGDCLVDDGNDCTRDQCDTQLGCVHASNDSACDDENECTADSCDPAGGCTHDPMCVTAADCSSDPCIIASCVDGCCEAVDRCPPTTGACRNVTGACDDDGACIEENEPDGTPCDSATGSTQCGDNGCDGACHEGQCVGAGCPFGAIQLSNGSCAIPCPAGLIDCVGSGCGPHQCTPTSDGPVCVRNSPAGGPCNNNNADCPVGAACDGAFCHAVCPP